LGNLREEMSAVLTNDVSIPRISVGVRVSCMGAASHRHHHRHYDNHRHEHHWYDGHHHRYEHDWYDNGNDGHYHRNDNEKDDQYHWHHYEHYDHHRYNHGHRNRLYHLRSRAGHPLPQRNGDDHG
jgi:hypothetical protein